MKSREDYLAEFLLSMSGPEMRNYRQRCLDFIRERYGNQSAEIVESKVRAKYNGGNPK